MKIKKFWGSWSQSKALIFAEKEQKLPSRVTRQEFTITTKVCFQTVNIALSEMIINLKVKKVSKVSEFYQESDYEV